MAQDTSQLLNKVWQVANVLAGQGIGFTDYTADIPLIPKNGLREQRIV